MVGKRVSDAVKNWQRGVWAYSPKPEDNPVAGAQTCSKRSLPMWQRQKIQKVLRCLRIDPRPLSLHAGRTEKSCRLLWPVRAENPRLEEGVVLAGRAVGKNKTVVCHVDRRRYRGNVELKARLEELNVLVRCEEILKP